MKSIFDFTGSVTAGDIERFITKGVNPNVKDDKGRTPLMMAVCYGYHSAADALVKAGASIDTQDNYGNTALMLAAFAGMHRVIDKVLSYNPNLNLTDSRGGSALTSCFENSFLSDDVRESVIEKLLKSGAVPDQLALAIPLIKNLSEKMNTTRLSHA